MVCSFKFCGVGSGLGYAGAGVRESRDGEVCSLEAAGALGKFDVEIELCMLPQFDPLPRLHAVGYYVGGIISSRSALARTVVMHLVANVKTPNIKAQLPCVGPLSDSHPIVR